MLTRAASSLNASKEKKGDTHGASGKKTRDHVQDFPLKANYYFGNAVGEDEAKELYEKFAVPASGKPLFQSGAANFNPWTEAKVEKSPERGPLLILDGEKDHVVPWAIAHATFKQQEGDNLVTEIEKIPDRGHSITIDHGWREVADKSLAFVQRYLTIPEITATS